MTIPTLEGWTALPQAAGALGLTRQGFHFRINQGLVPMESLRQVEMGNRRLILVANQYIEEEQAK